MEFVRRQAGTFIMLTDTIRHFIGALTAYRTPLFLFAVAAALGSLWIAHPNSPEETLRALERVYNGQPHYELRLVQPDRPTK